MPENEGKEIRKRKSVKQISKIPFQFPTPIMPALVNRLAPELFFFLILAHPVYKM